MTKEITQEERLDLTDVKEEKEAFAKCIEDKIKNLLNGTKDFVIIDTKDLYAENKRLKEQLDREIKINRKLVKALKEYAKLKPMNVFIPGKLYIPSQGEIPYDLVDIAEKARKVLKEIDNKE